MKITNNIPNVVIERGDIITVNVDNEEITAIVVAADTSDISGGAGYRYRTECLCYGEHKSFTYVMTEMYCMNDDFTEVETHYIHNDTYLVHDMIIPGLDAVLEYHKKIK